MLAGWPQCRQSSRGGWAYTGAIEQEGKGSPYLGQKFWSCSMTKAFKDAFEDGCMDEGSYQRTINKCRVLYLRILLRDVFDPIQVE